MARQVDSRRVRHPLIATLAVAVAVYEGACSTLEVEDAYVTANKATTLEVSSVGTKVSVGFIPVSTFNSFGTLGVPAIPVRATSRHADELNLQVRLGLTAHHGFTLANPVCLTFASGEELCSQRVTLSAAVVRRDGASPSGWQNLGSFGPYGPGLVISPAALAGRPDIDQGFVYSTIGYKGSPPWDVLHVSLIYTFKCATECPAQLRVHGEHLVAIDGEALPVGSLEFHRAKSSHYRFATDPGP